MNRYRNGEKGLLERFKRAQSPRELESLKSQSLTFEYAPWGTRIKWARAYGKRLKELEEAK